MNKVKHQSSSAYDKSCCFSNTILFRFIYSKLKLANKKKLTIEDLDEPVKADKASSLGFRLEKQWHQELKDKNFRRRKPKLINAVFGAFRGLLIFNIIFKGTDDLLIKPLTVILIGSVLSQLTILNSQRQIYHLNLEKQVTQNYQNATGAADINALVEQSSAGYNDALFDISIKLLLISLCCTLDFLISSPYLFTAMRMGMQVRIAICHLAYKKSLRINKAALSNWTIGKTINLFSTDVNKFDEFGIACVYAILAPAQSIVIMIISSMFYIGIIPTASAFATVLIYFVIQSLMGKDLTIYRESIASLIDARFKLINELLSAVKIIKMYAWEKPFARFVDRSRYNEIEAIKKANMLRLIASHLSLIQPKIVASTALLAYFITSDTFTPTNVFVTLNLASLLQDSVAVQFPRSIAMLAECLITFERVDQFLILPEVSDVKQISYKLDVSEKISSTGEASIKFDDAAVSWNITSSDSLLEDRIALIENKEQVISKLNVSLAQDDLLLVIGKAGSGKSSFLNAIIHELPITAGSYSINGTVSYASQEPWIFPGTVRDNILFGLEYDETRFSRVAQVCCLIRDFELLSDADLTVVGDNGVSLSGGQRARINLARAIYRETDIYLLDDPLSAVDAPVANHIFEQCLINFLHDKLVVLATHQLQFLQHASKVLLLTSPDVEPIFGTLEDVVNLPRFHQQHFAQYEIKKALERNKSNPEKERKGENAAQLIKTLSQMKDEANNNDSQGEEKLTDVSVNLSTYLFYIKACFGWYGMFLFSIISFVALFFYQYSDYYLQLWSDSVERKQLLVTDFIPQNYVDDLTTLESIIVYASLLFALILSLYLVLLVYFWGTTKASINLHDSLLKNVIRAPMKLFDVRPVGIFVNIFTNDINEIDEVIAPYSFLSYMGALIIVSTIVMSVVLNYINLPAALVTVSLFVYIGFFAFGPINRFKQIERFERSSIYTHILSSIRGISTIRISNSQEIMLELYENYQNLHTSAFFSMVSGCRWIGAWVNITVLIYQLASSIVIILILRYSSLDAALLGLLLTQTLSLFNLSQDGVRLIAEHTLYMNSVQRVRNYQRLESEDEVLPIIKEGNKDPQVDSAHQSGILKDRIVDGTIEFKNVTMRYREDKRPVLKDLCFSIAAREKIGIVGRTGSGKSSIISILFRLYDFEGKILIDGVDTKSVDLGALRSCMSIIPQEPVLFGASVRKNLDPVGEHSDESIWRVLEIVELKQKFDNLEHEIVEGGDNLSVGQRQLICLARAILRNNNILILDEATANVDLETDAHIQHIIATEFANCTVITIAHRLMTIASVDKILVLDAGNMIEFDAPAKLAANRDSLFSQMVDSSLDGNKIRQIISSSCHQNN